MVEKEVRVYFRNSKDATQMEREKEQRVLSFMLRGQEIIKYRTIVEGLRTLVDSPVENGTITAVKDALERLDDCMRARMLSNEKVIKEGYEVNNKEVAGDIYEQTLIEYNQVRNECQKLIGTQDEKLTAKRLSVNTNIRLQKLNFEIFTVDVRMYPRFHDDFQNHIKPLYAENEEAFVLRSYLSSDVKEDIYITSGMILRVYGKG